MSDLPPDLPRLRILETWHQVQLQRIRDAITTAERNATDQRKAERQQAAQVRDRVKPPPADWTVEWIRGTRQPLTVHVGDCYMPGNTDPIAKDEAVRLIAGGVEPCQFCRPDTALGL
ncbi:DUF6233 domain-containing protein [Streptomyces sp. NPDC096310]|uniref:DUF6233 domain-containing protein n=1 Tax=Streptomyces sp. NPDC096310 TaxID=3366082 RepID=UPI00382713FF